jgi:septum formation protein
MNQPVNNERPLVLASASPRRHELVRLLGIPFTTAQAGIPERARPGERPPAAVQRFAREKAATVARQVDGRNAAVSNAIVVGADTAVVVDGRILGKPADAAEARAMLRDLRGRCHQVYTALALIPLPGGEPRECLALTEVPMRAYTDADIDRYIASGDPFDKAGAYAIQNPDFAPVPHLEGCYANVMGLPLCHLTARLRTLGVDPPADVPRACQAATGYHCPVYGSILDPQAQPCRGGFPEEGERAGVTP